MVAVIKTAITAKTAIEKGPKSIRYEVPLLLSITDGKMVNKAKDPINNR